MEGKSVSHYDYIHLEMKDDGKVSGNVFIKGTTHKGNFPDMELAIEWAQDYWEILTKTEDIIE